MNLGGMLKVYFSVFGGCINHDIVFLLDKKDLVTLVEQMDNMNNNKQKRTTLK